MKLTSNEALNMIEKLKGKTNNDNWIKHCICVGNTAGKISVALTLDEDYAKTLGYIHDIGKQFNYVSDGVYPHAIKGYNYLKELGYDEEYAGICIKHSFLNNDINCLANSTNETKKLKKYFDDKLGYDLYDLFPESKNN